jgi:uncharacterized SAM-binding protein YcdF (DUF218 family)
MSWFATNFISAFLLPPLNLLFLLLIAIVLFNRHPKFARALALTTFILLWLASTPYITQGTLHLLESQTKPLPANPATAGAIVILGGGTYFNAPEYANQDTISNDTLVRLRYGAKLYREFKTPILTTGGKPLGNISSEAQQMRSALEQDFRVPVQWTEDAADNTLENARNTYQTLHKQQIHSIYLVTQAWHMPRSAAAFRQAGFTVIEAPTAFTTRYQTDLLTFIPRAEALRESKIFAHEVIGLLWYQAKSLLSHQTHKDSA